MTPIPITGATRVLAIFGRPIIHVLSPMMHNAALTAGGVDAVLVPFSPPPEALEQSLRGIVAAGCAGLCITIPYKTAVVPMMDSLAPSARLAGAVNTVQVGADRQLSGYNTDVEGVLRGLRALNPRLRRRAVLLGAGGAARAAAAALALGGVERLTVLNRTLEKASALARDLAADGMAIDSAPLDFSNLARHLGEADLLVNTTSVGMYPQGRETPVPGNLLRPGLDVIDAIYRPEPTRLCREARATGAEAVTGLDWIIAQGAFALKHWLGLDADEAAMRTALVRYLTSES